MASTVMDVMEKKPKSPHQKSPGKFSIGIDVGSVSIKIVVLNEAQAIVESGYWRHLGQPLKILQEKLESLEARYPLEKIKSAALTGSGSHRLADNIGAVFVNEVIAQSRAIEHQHPEVRTLIELGGQDSKLVLLKFDESQGRLSIDDFAMNSACAAGTGSFLDQQASRLGVKIEEEFGRLALESTKPPRVAGRCSVFAKSDMIHLQQQATPDYDILAGLCFALARNFISNLGRGKKFEKPIAFQGGVAHNLGVVRAFEELLSLEPEELIIPAGFDRTGALGAILEVLEKGKQSDYIGSEGLKIAFDREASEERKQRLAPLAYAGDPSTRHYIGNPETPPEAGKKTEAYLGIDVGSISTNVVAIDEAGHVLAKRYLMTAGRPIEAVRQGLREIGEEIADRIIVKGAGTTGSGRYLTGDFVGADTIRNEITAQATAAAAIDPEVDTIFEIGGQDSKYISLENGVVVDFEMNHACAAGTGSFLEEQAERLGINIKEEFGNLALKCQNPARLGERCTVFMESDVVHHQAQGAKTDQLVAGLSYSIVYNYLNRVVGDRRIGRKIFLQGGTMANAGVVAAFEKVVGQPMIVPRHHDVTGAIGMALMARDHMKKTGGETTFRGFDLSDRKYEIESFECDKCSNACEIKAVRIEGEEPLYYGARCDRYNVQKGDQTDIKKIPDLFKERTRLLLKDYLPEEKVLTDREGPTIGLPRILITFDLLPFWKTFFKALGVKVVMTPSTNKKLVHQGVEHLANEPCFPVKVAHGHVLSLLEKEIDYLFLPSVINMDREDDHQRKNFLCPYVQTIPYTLRAALSLKDEGILRPVIHFQDGIASVAQELTVLGEALNRKPGEIKKASRLAWEALQNFKQLLRDRGKDILDHPEKAHGQLVVIIGRSYNTCDPGLNLDLPKKLRNLGVCPLPLDMLPLADVSISDDFPNMYWKYGQRIIKTAKLVRKDPRLAAIYLTNFSCGPDSFISSFFKKTMGEKPYLQLELDEHSADAGVITRCEAFIDSLNSCKWKTFNFPERVIPEEQTFLGKDGKGKKLFIPYMCEHAHVLSAAFRACGIDSEVLTPSDDESMTLGRRYTTGKECVPCVVTAGDMIRQLQSEGVDPDKVAFFMPSNGGPCRFGQYNAVHKLVLQEYNYHQVPIFAPNQDVSFYDQLKTLDGDPARLTWQGIVAVDSMEKILFAFRPYEKEPGLTDRVFQKYLKNIIVATEKKEDLLPILQEAAAAFKEIEPEDRGTKPVIGIVGEIYVRNHPFSNQNLHKRLEHLGAEIRLPSFGEWILYSNFTRKRQCRRNWEFKLYLKNFIKSKVQQADEKRLTEPFHGILPYIEEPPIEYVLGLGNRYLHDSFEGEAILSVGKSVEFAEEGIDGLINVMPLTCMPGTVTTAIYKKIREDFDNLPAITISYDGNEQPNLETRLEAFVHQARQFSQRGKKARVTY